MVALVQLFHCLDSDLQALIAEVGAYLSHDASQDGETPVDERQLVVGRLYSLGFSDECGIVITELPDSDATADPLAPALLPPSTMPAEAPSAAPLIQRIAALFVGAAPPAPVAAAASAPVDVFDDGFCSLLALLPPDLSQCVTDALRTATEAGDPTTSVIELVIDKGRYEFFVFSFL